MLADQIYPEAEQILRKVQEMFGTSVHNLQ